MLRRLTRGLRRWAATALVAAYAVGVLAPAAAFALGHGSSIVHVLAEHHAGQFTLHVHDDDNDNSQQPSDNTTRGEGHHCCGVVSLPGLVPSPAVSFHQPASASVAPALTEDNLSGCG